MLSDHLIALPTLRWIGEHPFWTLLTLLLLVTHVWRSPGRRRELVSELSFVMLSIGTILLIQFEGGWFRLPLPHHWLVEISGLVLSARQQEQQALLAREAESLRQVAPPRDLLDKLKALFGGR
jgi:hypothetical protein